LYDSVAYEVSILIVFSFSLVVWKTFSSTVLRMQKKVANVGCAPSRSQKDTCVREAWTSSNNVRQAMTPKALQHAAMEIMTLSQDKYTIALRLYRELIRNDEDCNIREEAFYFALVSASIRVGHPDVVKEVLVRAKKHKVKLSVAFFQSVLKLLAAKHLFTDCLDIEKIFGEHLPMDRIICSCISLAAAEAGQPEAAIQLVERLQSCGEEVTGKDYQNIFRVFVKSGNHAAATKLLKKLIKSGVPFEPVIMNIVLSTCVVSNNTETAHAFLEKAAKSDGAIPVDVVSYNTVIKGYARQHKLKACFELIEAMHATGISSDEVTYSTILDACISENQFAKATEVIDSFMKSGFVMNTVLCTTFMKGFIKMDMLDKAMALYSQMRHPSSSDNDAKPDVIMYSVLIKANCDQRLVETALHLVKDMIKDGLVLDDMIINRLLDGCRHISDSETADKLFKEFVVSGKIKPTLPTIATMVKIYGKCNRVDEAARIVATAHERFKLEPTVVLYTCLMSACTRNRRLDLAVATYDLMIKARVQPDAMTYSTLFRGCTAERDWERAIHIARAASNQPRSSFPTEEITIFLEKMSCSRDSFQGEVLRAVLRSHSNTTPPDSVAPWRK